MTRLIGRVASRQVVPRRAGAQHPEDAIEYRARIGPGPAPPVGAHGRPKEGFDRSPLGVGQVHAVRYDALRRTVTLLQPFMR